MTWAGLDWDGMTDGKEEERKGDREEGENEGTGRSSRKWERGEKDE